jgi:hypothetical protein
MKFSTNRARTDLKSAGIIQVDYTQEQPPRLLVRVNTATVLACISVDHSSARLKTKNAPFRSLPQSNTKGNRISRCQVQRTNWNYWSPAQQRNEIMRLISRTGGLGKLNSVEMGDANVGTDQAEVTSAYFATCIRQQEKAAAPTKSASQLFPFCETGSSLSRKLDVPKVENWIAPFYETKSSLSAKLFIQIEVTNTTTTKQEVEPVASQEGWSRSGNSEITKPSNSITTCLVFPDALDKRRQASALKDISCAPGPLQQSILDELDEWDGALQSGKTIRNIAGWLAGWILSLRRPMKAHCFLVCPTTSPRFVKVGSVKSNAPC